LRHAPTLDEAAVEQLSSSLEARHVGFGAPDLRASWAQMISSRDEVLALFR
jgi:hypothetical protein